MVGGGRSKTDCFNQYTKLLKFTNFSPRSSIESFNTEFNTRLDKVNGSNGAPDELRPILNQVYLMMLANLGQESAIVDAFDKEMMDQ